MTEERLKEIRDNIDKIEIVSVRYRYSNILNEEIELYNEVVRLREIIKHYEETQTFGDYVKEVNLLVDYKTRNEKAIEFMEKNKKISLDDTTSIINFYNNLLDILKQNNLTLEQLTGVDNA